MCVFQYQTLQHVYVWIDVIATCVCLDRSRCNGSVFGQNSLQKICVWTELAATDLCFDRSRRNMSVFQHVVIVINYVCVTSTSATTTCPFQKIARITAFFYFYFYSTAFITLGMCFSNMHQYNHSCVVGWPQSTIN